MISSMTGFGSGTAQTDSLSLTVEIRTVNSRFCEFSFRVPRTMNRYENALQNLAKEYVSRGRVTIQIQASLSGAESLPVQIKKSSVAGYTRLLQQLKETAGIDEPVTLTHLLQFQEIFMTVDEVEEPEEEAWQAIQVATTEALKNLISMRRKEGKLLQQDLQKRIQNMRSSLELVMEKAPSRIVEAKKRLHSRIEELVEDERFDKDRLELEVAILADKLDITEECVRLDSHFVMFLDAMQEDEAVGRKLNFITQEINREVNTISSKGNDSEVIHLAVGMKEELEKIREQVQNIE